MEEIRKNLFLSTFNGLLWMFPAITAIILVMIIGPLYPLAFLYAIFFLIGYHFAGMYYIIKGPMLELRPVKKKGFFGKI